MSKSDDIFKEKYPLSKEKIFSVSETMKRLENGKPEPVKKIKIITKRRLTEKEIIMCRSVFKDSIQYKDVWVVMQGFVISLLDTAVTPIGRIITIPRKEYIENQDFSNAAPSLKHWFIHEMTHVWQNELGFKSLPKLKRVCRLEYFKTTESADNTTGEDLVPYATDLMGRDIYKNFNEFNYEQQGRIIELYFDAKFLKYSQPQRKHHQLSIKLKDYVMRTLKDFINNPSDKSLLPYG